MTIAALLVAGFSASPARAADAPLSSGCVGLSSLTYDVLSSAEFAGSGMFQAGERIVLTAGVPDSGSPQQIQIMVDYVVVQTAAYPGTLTYVVPADSTFSLTWLVSSGEATWSVDCLAPGAEPVTSPPPAPSTCVARGNENAERASQNGKDHSCGIKQNPHKAANASR